MRRRTALTALALWPALAHAQAYPARPIRLIIPYPPGGGTDALSRPWAERMRVRLGQPLIIENRGGAATNIGMELAARAAPDGQTLIINADNVALFPHLYQRLGYDLFRDFMPITYLAQSPLVLGINPALPVRNLREFVALLQREPEKYSFANPSIGSPHHLGFELFAREAGVRMIQVEYRGGGPALNDVLAGHVQLGVFSLGAVSSHFQAGTLRPLALLSPTRSAAAPDIPTTAEEGLPAVVNALRFLLFAPAQTPRPIIETLHAASVESLAEPALRDALTRAGFEIMTTTPEQAMAMLRAENQRWAPILPGLNLRLD
ncbi:tripartite tricarboxylate transporter substrate-binding protein [Sediminicoccus sp. KRV36]|uniref:Bug family tripartite tricarboxylate transporter substrate binding protein n=1 Tax=Sediminicoccus sp. KRV36 TaxID=3133721 RepID=UPI00200EE135|nr:tripartite tricarboxylate transporter substrate-binding protein [Sediminicoccus rosea]UPY36579.1 tripartite tricarboxylate transporter substrate binding protein [Sediminicoccus rosea]